METLEIMPVRVRITAILRKAIYSGEYKSGDELSLTDVAARLGVSRTPVREALTRLEQSGLILMEAGRSARVLGVTSKDLCDIYDIRMRVEGLAARLAAQNRDEEGLRALEDAVELEEFYMAKGNADQIKNTDSRFHREIYRQANNYQLQLMLTDMHHRIQRYRRMSLNVPDRAMRMSGEHRLILEDIRRGDGDAAERDMIAHIARAKENLLRLVQEGNGPDDKAAKE